jgi:hypothetical protein
MSDKHSVTMHIYVVDVSGVSEDAIQGTIRELEMTFCCEMLKKEVDPNSCDGFAQNEDGTWTIWFEGMDVYPGVRFCPFCGAKLDTPLPTPE